MSEDQSWYVQKLLELQKQVELGLIDINDVFTDAIMQQFRDIDNAMDKKRRTMVNRKLSI